MKSVLLKTSYPRFRSKIQLAMTNFSSPQNELSHTKEENYTSDDSFANIMLKIDYGITNRDTHVYLLIDMCLLFLRFHLFSILLLCLAFGIASSLTRLAMRYRRKKPIKPEKENGRTF